MTDQGANPDLSFKFELPIGHLNLSPDTLVMTLSEGFSVANDAAFPDGTVVGGVEADLRIGLINGPCNTPISADFILYDSTTDIDNVLVMQDYPPTVIAYDGDDPYSGKADSASPPVHFYPDVNNQIFDPDGSGDASGGYEPVAPYARYSGATEVWGEWQLLQVFIFQPGAIKAAFDANPANATHPFSRLHSTLGWTSVALINFPIGFGKTPLEVTDTCSSLGATLVFLGRVDTNGDEVPDADRLISPSAVGGIDGEGTHLAQHYTLSLRDTDEDGVDNGLDNCPNAADQEDAWLNNGPDSDGLDSVCDPAPSTTSTAAPPPNGVDNDSDTFVDEDPTDGLDNDGDTATDEDGNCPVTAALPDEDQDCYSNRQDNCPISFNAGQIESEFLTTRILAAPDGGPWNDEIGDACDSQPTVANGRFFHFFDSDAFCINDTPGADGDGDGWCHIAAGADPDDSDANKTGRKLQDADKYLFGVQPGHAHSNYNEVWMQTDPLADCPEVVGKHDAWPPDFTKDRLVNTGDTIAGFGQGQLLTSEGQPGYDRRSDANADGQINVGDVTVLMGGGVMLTSCSPS